MNVTVPRTSFGSRVVRVFRRIRSEVWLRRETDVMGLTVAIALLAALSAGNDTSPHSKLDVLAIVWGTTVGLALTHWFALLVTARLVSDPDIHYRPTELLISQTVMASVVAICATLVVLAVSTEFDRLGARITAAVFIGVLVSVESRTGGAARQRALAIGFGAMAIAMAIAWVKWSLNQ